VEGVVARGLRRAASRRALVASAGTLPDNVRAACIFGEMGAPSREEMAFISGVLLIDDVPFTP
jgi:hypothetical protein